MFFHYFLCLHSFLSITFFLFPIRLISLYLLKCNILFISFYPPVFISSSQLPLLLHFSYNLMLSNLAFKWELLALYSICVRLKYWSKNHPLWLLIFLVFFRPCSFTLEHGLFLPLPLKFIFHQSPHHATPYSHIY